MNPARFAAAAPVGLLLAPAPTSPLVARVGDTGFIQLEAPSFSQLTPKQQALAYYLTQASIAIDPIIYDQLSRFGVREKRLLEGIVAYQRHATGSAVYGGLGPDAVSNIERNGTLSCATSGP